MIIGAVGLRQLTVYCDDFRVGLSMRLLGVWLPFIELVIPPWCEVYCDMSVAAS